MNYRSDSRRRRRGSNLPPGAQTPVAGERRRRSARPITLTKTLGLFAQEQAAFRDRLFLTAAVRTDQNSAFGTNFQRVYYPKAACRGSSRTRASSRTWTGSISCASARVRRVGRAARATDALRTFATTLTSINGADISGERANLLGNANLKPEKSTEFEGGLRHRAASATACNFEFTYYNKQSKDALIDQTLAPARGRRRQHRRRPTSARCRTPALESLLNGQVIDRRISAWDVTFNASHNTNKLVTLGNDPTRQARFRRSSARRRASWKAIRSTATGSARTRGPTPTATASSRRTK